jgi:hypothetical protein
MRVAAFIPSRRARATLALGAGAFVAGLAPVADGDLWWHLAAGREIVRTHLPPAFDTLSAGAAGRPWVDLHWGFQLAAYAIHSVGGLTALVIVKCVLVATGALVLMGAVRRSAGPQAQRIFAVACVLTLFVGRSYLLLRPVIPTLVFLASFFYALERFRDDGRLRWLVALPLLQVAWANLQGLSMFGPALVGAYAVAMGVSAAWGGRSWFPFAPEAPAATDARRRARLLMTACGLCLAACVATPYGFTGATLPFRLLLRLAPTAENVYAANVVENVPPWVLARSAPGQLAPLLAFLMAAAAAVLFARRLRLAHVLVLVGLAALALAANRNVLLLYWLGTPIIVMVGTPALRRVGVALRRARWAGRLALPAALALVIVASVREPSVAAPAPFRAPETSADVVAARGGTGTVFAADQFGGYLAWRLGPAWKPWIDTRLVLRTPEEFAEYLALADEPLRFDEWERAHPVDYVLLPVGYPDRYLGLVAHLHGSEGWRLIHTNGSEVLFAHSSAGAPDDVVHLGSEEVVEELLANIAGRFADAALADAARLQLATLELTIGEQAQAERVLDRTGGDAADGLRARCRFMAGDLDGAARAARTILARDEDDVRSLDLLAAIAARRGEHVEALALLRRALRTDSFDAEANRMLDTWEANAQSTR